jgi:hypothetical protein
MEIAKNRIKKIGVAGPSLIGGGYIGIQPENIGVLVVPPHDNIPEMVLRAAEHLKDQDNVIIVGDGNQAYGVDKGVVRPLDEGAINELKANGNFLNGRPIGEPEPMLIRNYHRDYLDTIDMDYINGAPNKLNMLRQLNLSPEQIEFFIGSPNHRLDGEDDKEYQTRRSLSKLLIKYRGEI